MAGTPASGFGLLRRAATKGHAEKPPAGVHFSRPDEQGAPPGRVPPGGCPTQDPPSGLRARQRLPTRPGRRSTGRVRGRAGLPTWK